MIETYVIGDSHFGHKNIIKFDSTRPYRQFETIEEHDEELIKRWNSVVKKNDNVFHLGDFCFGKKNIEIAGRLNGNKRLVLGNHDVYPAAEYLKYFSRIFGAIEYKKCILTHIPVHTSQFERFKLNIHGHLHAYYISDERYVNVSCEQIDLTPISFDVILQQKKELFNE